MSRRNILTCIKNNRRKFIISTIIAISLTLIRSQAASAIYPGDCITLPPLRLLEINSISQCPGAKQFYYHKLLPPGLIDAKSTFDRIDFKTFTVKKKFKNRILGKFKKYLEPTKLPRCQLYELFKSTLFSIILYLYYDEIFGNRLEGLENMVQAIVDLVVSWFKK